jgi:exopolysaccharide/PEP-CTERM locus tyrosine autokinase
MSIIDKALTKARATAQRDDRPVPPSRPRSGGSIKLDLAHLQEEGLLVPSEHARAVRNQYRSIKSPILDLALGRSAPRPAAANVIVVTSAVPGEGKTFSAVNLAMALALEREVSVVLIDADLARPRISSVLGLGDRQGLAEYLAGDAPNWRDLSLLTDHHGMIVLPAGRAAGRGPELLATSQMDALLAEVTRPGSNEIVVIDSAPLLATNEARVLVRHAGQIVMVVRANSTLKPEFNEALSMLNRSKPIGLILNQARTVFGDYYYGQYGDYDQQVD